MTPPDVSDNKLNELRIFLNGLYNGRSLPNKEIRKKDIEFGFCAGAYAACGKSADDFYRCFGEIMPRIDIGGVAVALTEKGCAEKVSENICRQSGIFTVWKERADLDGFESGLLYICKMKGLSFYSGLSISLEQLCKKQQTVHFEEKKIERLMGTGSYEQVLYLLSKFFDEIKNSIPPADNVREETAKLINCILKFANYDIGSNIIGKLITENITINFIDKLSQYIIAEIRGNKGQGGGYSPMIADTIEIISKNLSNEDLSLRWIAQEILFTNADYLGKLFKKEVGDNFTGYVKRQRMELAKKLILEGKRDRIYEVAEKVGFGTNSQYFSQVFKKYTGVSPLEYKMVAQNL